MAYHQEQLVELTPQCHMIFKSIAVTLFGVFSVLLAFLGGGYEIIGPQLFIAQNMLSTISLWEALEILSTLVVPFVILFLSALGKLIWSIHKRLKRQEKINDKHAKTLYGDSDDVMHEGLSQEMRDLKGTVTNIETMLDNISRQLDEQNSDDDDDDE